jgi:hypothetical protein
MDSSKVAAIAYQFFESWISARYLNLSAEAILDSLWKFDDARVPTYATLRFDLFMRYWELLSRLRLSSKDLKTMMIIIEKSKDLSPDQVKQLEFILLEARLRSLELRYPEMNSLLRKTFKDFSAHQSADWKFYLVLITHLSQPTPTTARQIIEDARNLAVISNEKSLSDVREIDLSPLYYLALEQMMDRARQLEFSETEKISFFQELGQLLLLNKRTESGSPFREASETRLREFGQAYLRLVQKWVKEERTPEQEKLFQEAAMDMRNFMFKRNFWSRRPVSLGSQLEKVFSRSSECRMALEDLARNPMAASSEHPPTF